MVPGRRRGSALRGRGGVATVQRRVRPGRVRGPRSRRRTEEAGLSRRQNHDNGQPEAHDCGRLHEIHRLHQVHDVHYHRGPDAGAFRPSAGRRRRRVASVQRRKPDRRLFGSGRYRGSKRDATSHRDREALHDAKTVRRSTMSAKRGGSHDSFRVELIFRSITCVLPQSAARKVSKKLGTVLPNSRSNCHVRITDPIMRHIGGALLTRSFCTKKPNVLVYNFKTKTKEPLKRGKTLTWYVCGPTVYDSMHIGHASCYVKFDIMRRILENYFHSSIFQVMNITDIDDKIIAKARAFNVDPVQIARNYEVEFIEDMKMLNIKPPHVMARVTDFIPQVLSFIQDLFDKDLVYSSLDGSLFFDTTKYRRYGKFVPVPEIIEHSFKKSNLDFALWKAAKPGEPSWNSSWGPGRPGWHIECSAIASHYFGSSVDIHSGGIDLLFPHHENEEAQCCAYHNVDDWVTHWIHTGHLHVGDNIKMSKSLKNTISVRDLLKSYTANQFRILCLLSNYKSDLEFSENTMAIATGVLKKFDSFLVNCHSHLKITDNKHVVPNVTLLEKIDDIESKILSNLADNFNTSKALNLLIELINIFNKSLKTESSFSCSKLEVIRAFNLVSHIMESFGIDLAGLKMKSGVENNLVVDIIVNFRAKLRQLALQRNSEINKQDMLKLCDNLRDDLSTVNITIQDSSKFSLWKYDQVINLKTKEKNDDKDG